MYLWDEILFRPLLNVLIALYNTIGWQNMGWSIVWLTIIVRVLLIPLSLQDENSRAKQQLLEKELRKVAKSYANNPALMREQQRETLKKFSYRRYPKVFLLGVQAVILVLVYQVFLGGVYVEKFVEDIYSFVSIPEKINTMFLGIDIAKRSLSLSILSSLILFGNIWAEHRKAGKKWTRKDLPLAIGFPLATFLFLYYLAAVKALFIISSQIFSNIIRVITAFNASIKEQDAYIAKKAEEEARKKESLPHFPDLF